MVERVWQELAKGLMEANPSRMFDVLRDCGALAKLLPELDRLFGVPQRADFHPEVDTGIHVMMALDFAAQQRFGLPVRFAVLLHDLGKGLTPADVLPRHLGHEARGVDLVEAVCGRLRPPAECRELARLVTRFHGDIRRGRELRAATMVKLLEHADAFRRPERFWRLLDACACDFHGRLGWQEKPMPEPELFLRVLAAARAVDAGAIARACEAPARIPERIHAARVHAVESVLVETGE